MTKNVVPITARGGPVTKTAWLAYVRKPLQRPRPITAAKYAAATPAQQADFDRARRAYHRSLADLETRQMLEAHAQIDSRVDGNEACPPTARTGLVINGLPNHGKSTMLLRWGFKYEHELRQRYDVEWDARTDAGALFTPVAYVILGVNDGPKALCQKLMRFYEAPFSERWDHGELTSRLGDITTMSATSVILIDQMQNLQMRHQSMRDTAEHLKELMDVLPSTLVGAGVEMEHTGFFTEGNKVSKHDISQIAKRFGVYNVTATDPTTRQGAQDWKGLLATVGDRLVLLRKRENDLAGLGDYIYERTNGVVGDLMDLVRRGANAAVGGDERITKTLLDTIVLSQGSNQIVGAPGTSSAMGSSVLSDAQAAEVGRTMRRVRATG